MAHLLQSPFGDAEQGAVVWQNCTVAGAAAFVKPPGVKFLRANVISLVSKLRLELGAVWAKQGLSTCVVVDAGNPFFTLRINRCTARRVDCHGCEWVKCRYSCDLNCNSSAAILQVAALPCNPAPPIAARAT